MVKIDKYKAELIGAIIGDGNLYCKDKHYRIGFTGSPINDILYFKKLKYLISKV